MFATVIVFLAGYFLCYFSNRPEEFDEVAQRLKRKLSKKRHVGVVVKLTAEEKRKKGTPAEAEEKQMTKVLDKTFKRDG